MLKCSLLFLASIAMVFGLSGVASALPCGTGGVSGSVACQDGALNNNNDFPAPTVINSENFFGYNDWEYINIYDAPGGYDQGTAAQWNVTPGSGSWPDTSGDWSFTSTLWNQFEDVMIVVKDGRIDDIFHFLGIF